MDNYGYVPEENNGRPCTISRPDSSIKEASSTNFLVGINARFKPQKKTIYYKRSTIVLTVLIILLLIGLVLVLVYYRKSKLPQPVCTSDECIRSAFNLKYSINFSVDPCEDFYNFCCGRWSEEHPNHGWFSSFSTFTTVTEKVIIQSMSALSDEVKNDEPKPISDAKRFYESCTSTDSIDALGLSPLYETLAMLKLPVIPNYFNESRNTDTFDWTRTEVLMKIMLAMDVFIGFTVQPNTYQRHQNVIFLGVLYQSTPLPAPFSKDQYKNSWKKRNVFRRRSSRNSKHIDADDDNDDDDDKEQKEKKELRTKIRTIIIKHVTGEIMKNNSFPEVIDDQLELAADIINNITYFLDELNDNHTQPPGELELENRNMTIQEIQDLTDNNVKSPMPSFWIDYLGILFANVNVTIDPKKDLIHVTDLEQEYLWKVLDYVAGQPSLHIELYMWWSAVYSMLLSTSSDITTYVLEQTSLYYAGTSKDTSPIYITSRSIDCCQIVSEYMGWAVSYAVADKTFANETKPKVEKMIDDIKKAFVEHVRSITWMDSSTKKVTLEKSEEMLSFVGYPDWLFEKGELEKEYDGIEVNETTYLANMISIIKQYTTKTLSSLRHVNERDWSTEAITVNAFNSFSDNAINVPIAILVYPFYNLGLEVLNYGSIGAIIGHELTHGFDNIGREFDKYGNFKQWWTNQTIDTFENLTKCFVDQYDNFTIEGLKEHVKGKVTLGENLADNGGLSQAYTAYRKYREIHGEEPKLPGFEDLTNDQLFFIAYGSIWCETISLDDLKNQIEYDEHCPNSVRVIGTLQNSDDFAKAFKCPLNSHMNPKRSRCKIW